MKIIKYIGLLLGLLLLIVIDFGIYLNRGLPHEIKPAAFNCLSLKDGTFTSFDTLPKSIG